jgi:uncharacterized protein with ParB-like and HNH nuclease domain
LTRPVNTRNFAAHLTCKHMKAPFKLENYFYSPQLSTDTWTLARFKCCLEMCKEEYNLDLDPPFQRGYVWTVDQQRAFVEYILQGGTSGRSFYFNDYFKATNENKYVVVDGKQRITAVSDFIDGKFEVFDGYTWEDIKDEVKTSNLYFEVHVAKLSEKEVVKWYLSMNKGGSVHTQEDLKVAMDYLKTL